MNEADERFAERLAEDLERYLGPEITLSELDLGEVDANVARVRATCSFYGEWTDLEATGATRLDAYNQLILRAAELRMVVAMRNMDEDAIIGMSIAWGASLNPESRP